MKITLIQKIKLNVGCYSHDRDIDTPSKNTLHKSLTVKMSDCTLIDRIVFVDV